MRYQDKNIETIERWIDEGWQWGKPIDHETFLRAKQGDYELFLTPTRPIPKAWLEGIKGKRVLGLAAGGGQQMPILKAIGANCVCLDYSAKQLESDKNVAIREGYGIVLVQADMTDGLPFEDEAFDLIVHPVANCYIEDVWPLWKECYRVLRKGGEILSGLDLGVNYIVDEDEKTIINGLPFNPLKDPRLMAQLDASDAGVQFSHSLEDQIQGQLAAGFHLLELFEDYNEEGNLARLHIPSFIATRARKD